ncbi:hypothetical protein WG926_21490 [Tistrella sp. BH-R2-4]|uniref:Uncharacterized protein n=1 Tax=Tistrella arctica TaxID=3133430 RepID=A0ABU9YQ22_9PROT
MDGKCKDSSEIAAHVDLYLAVHRCQHDILDQRPDDIGGLCALLFVLALQGVVEALDARAVELRHRGMQEGRWVVGFCEEGFHFLLPLLQANHLRIDPVGSASLEDQVEQGVQFAIDFLYLSLRRRHVGATFHSETIDLLCEDLTEPSEQRRVDEPGAQGVQDAGLELIATDVDAIVASALVSRRRATDQRR